MKKLLSSRITIILFLALFVGAIWYLSGYVGKIRENAPSQETRDFADETSELVVTSSADPIDPVNFSVKSGEGVFRKIEDGKIFISNAYEDVAFTLGSVVNVQLIEVKERTDPKLPPETPKQSTIDLEDLVEYDQLVLTLEKTSDNYIVTSIIATRIVK